jgi:drug/metabolite transporter (DMT)-like permease
MTDVPSPDPRQLLLGFFFATMVAIIWSGWMVASRFGATHALLVSDITLLRFLGSGLIMAPVFVARWPEIRDAGWRPVLVLSMMGGVPYSLISVGGLVYAPTAQGAVVIPGALAVFATLLGWAWLGERPTRERTIGLVLVVAALALIGVEGARGGSWQGAVLFLLAAFMWSAFTVGTRYYGLRPLTNVAVIACVPLLWYGPLLLAFNETRIFEAPWSETALQLVYQGLLAGALAPIMYTRAIRTVGPQRAALVMVLVPVLATLQAWAILAEVPGWLTIAGMILVLPGLALAGGAVSFRRS